MMGIARNRDQFIVVMFFITLIVFVWICFENTHTYASVDERRSDKPMQKTSAELEEDFVFLQNNERINLEKRYIKPHQPTVYLTFDDGPSPLTPAVLDILKEENVQATFFVIGKSAEKHTDTIQRIIAEGHAIGNHTYDHRYEHMYTQFADLWTQVQRTNDILQETAGVQTRLFRAPGGTHGHFDAFYFYYLNAAGYETYDWNIDSGDARRRGVPAEEILANVTKGPLHHEMHVLLHDSAGHEETLKVLPDIIRFFKQKGYQFQPLSTDVKPVQQSMSAPRWNRSYTLLQHRQTMEQMTAFLYESSIQERSSLEEQAANELEVKSNPAYVSLRDWAEQQGGAVYWNEEKRTAFVSFKHVQLKWMPDTQTVERISLEGSKESTILSEINMQIEEGRIYIPVTFAETISSELVALDVLIKLMNPMLTSYTIKKHLEEEREWQKRAYGSERMRIISFALK